MFWVALLKKAASPKAVANFWLQGSTGTHRELRRRTPNAKEKSRPEAARMVDMELTAVFYHERGWEAMTNEELVAQIQSGQRDRLSELWRQVERFVYHKAGKWLVVPELKGKGGVEPEDLWQSGFLALVNAVDSFDPGKGMSFIGWFNYYLKTAFAEAYGLRTSRTRYEPLQRAISMSASPAGSEDDSITIGDMLPDQTAEAAFVDIEERDRKKRLYAALEAALEALPEAERAVLKARYYQDCTLEEISAERGVGRERVRQLELKGLRLLRHPKNNQGIRRHL